MILFLPKITLALKYNWIPKYLKGWRGFPPTIKKKTRGRRMPGPCNKTRKRAEREW